MTDSSSHGIDRDRDAPRITTLACPTRGRVRLLHRALTSYAEAFARHGRDVEIVVSDDATCETARRSCREMLRALGARFGFRISYAGVEEKELFAAELLRTSRLPEDLVRFALFGPAGARITTGANRNALLLHTLGEAVLSVDDDTIGRTAAPPSAEAGVVFAAEDRFSSSHPAQVWPFRNLAAALDALELRDLDPLAVHERFLGCPVEEHGRRSVVRATVNGFAGEHTWPSAMGYLFLTGESFERLTATPERYRDALASRCIVKAVPRSTIVDRCHHAPGLFLGLDNRTILPPFFPVGRGQDITWWEALARGLPDAMVAQLPLVMLHDPPVRRGFDLLEILRTVSRLPLNRVVAALMPEEGGEIASTLGAVSTSASGLRRLGSHLIALGRLPAPEFAALARARIRGELEVLYDRLELRIAREGKRRDLWGRDVKRFLWIARRTLAGDHVLIPRDLHHTGARGGAQERIQRLVLHYGELVAGWPDLVQASRELQARGRRVAAKV